MTKQNQQMGLPGQMNGRSLAEIDRLLAEVRSTVLASPRAPKRIPAKAKVRTPRLVVTSALKRKPATTGSSSSRADPSVRAAHRAAAVRTAARALRAELERRGLL